MDSILTTLGGSLPQLGTGGVLVFVIALLVKLLMDGRAEIEAMSKRHREELRDKGDRLEAENARELAQHKLDMADLRDQLRDERKRADDLLVVVDIERAARYEAEEAAARALRGHREGPR